MSRPITYSGMTATNPAMTRHGDEVRACCAHAITSSASISSEIRIAPSCAVKPQPTVAASASPATSGAISRVLKYAEMKPVSADVPSWSSAA